MMTSSSDSSSPVQAERRGIPAAQFVEDVQTYLFQSGLDVNSSLAFLQERLQQYKLVEMKLLAQQRDLQADNFKSDVDGIGLFAGYDNVLYIIMSIHQESVKVQSKNYKNVREIAKIPDIEKCLEIVATLQAKKGTGEPLVADFEVSEGIYSQARIEDTDSVCLWLGANVMLEYSSVEANALLRKNLDNAKASLEVLIADLQFLRDQVTVTQVTIARVYNWDVHQRRIRQAEAADVKDS